MIYLIGYMGSGKTTIAKKLSLTLNVEYIEMDESIEEEAGMSIPKIFEHYGEEYFRELETNLLRSLRGDKIVSTGGGVILKEENRELLQKGTVVFLHALFETIDERLSNDEHRPLWSAGRETNQKRYEQRLPLYQTLADYTIQVDHKTEEAITKEVLNCLKS
ncbi:shikimate kinase [Halobacillus sp. A5]|uniref:shikimate kinase n=1 Tax=Halobacillus sp. A5 TaxID=2880263 RepID=UPI0020A690BE|nr:shikimate kinase [Halobacillus sp. A5]MCP3025701.1 shikimate kinase [Halobacillus sp. A5]